MIFRAAVAILI